MVQGQYQLCAVDPGQFNGGLNSDGLREGIGNCTWQNGDVYQGDWKDNLRHGNGKFTCQDYEYVGQW